MEPLTFARKWRDASKHLSERAAAQEHFRDLCAMLGHPTPSSDTSGRDFAFERPVRKVRDASSPALSLLVAHERLDAAVAAAYGWEWPLTEEEVLGRLLALNLLRSSDKQQDGRHSGDMLART